MGSEVLLDLLREFLLEVIASSFVPETFFSSSFRGCSTEQGLLTVSNTSDSANSWSSTMSFKPTTGSEEEKKTELIGHDINYNYGVCLSAYIIQVYSRLLPHVTKITDEYNTKCVNYM